MSLAMLGTEDMHKARRSAMKRAVPMAGDLLL